MNIYVVTLFLCLLIAMMAYQNVYIQSHSIKKVYNLDIRYKYKAIFIILSMFLIVIVGLRADIIGIDTLNYKNAYFTIGKQSFLFLNNYKWYEEPGYTFIIILFNKLNISWQVYLIFMASLFIVPVVILIFKNTENIFFALAIFIMSGLWIYPMSTMRQAAAIGITIIAFMFENKKKNLVCLLLIFMASLIHISALITIIYFLILKIPINKKNLIVWILVGILIVVMGIGPLRNSLFKIMNFVNRDYQKYSSVGGWLQEAFFILSLGIGWIFCENEQFWKWYKAIFLCAILLPIIRVNPTLFRIYMYFSVYQIIFIPELLLNIKQKTIKVLGYMGYLLVYLYLFFTQSMVSSLKIIPYKFFWM